MIRRVLIVDDVALNREILKAMLHNEYETMEAENGEEALAVIQRSYKLISAVLLDIVMPVMDGYAVLQRMRENPLLGQIPVIVVTGSEDDSARVKALSLGANDFINKPYSPEIILHCLRNNIALRETASIVNAIQKDKLTGIYNREFFFEKTEAELRGSEPGAFVLTCFDIDNFKLVNDQYGAKEGDRILKHIGALLNEAFSDVNGLCGRISGDNFAGLFPNTPEATKRIDAIHKNGITPADSPANLFFSVGRYVISDPTLPASALYDRAFIAKQSIKGRYDERIAYFSDSMLDTLLRERQITADMDVALRKHQFEVWYQPQYNHVTGALIGAEALVRWRHPDKGLIPPGDFIPLFEENGFIYELDKFVWESVCQHLGRMQDEGLSPLPVSVNVSRYDLFKPDLIDTLTKLCRKYGISPALLRLEVTESAFSKSTDRMVSIVKQLIVKGYTVEIDDFGSGYSSLNTLKDVPAQILKLDMKFMAQTADTQRGGNVLESVVRMAKWLDMSVIAEGVETREQADFLKSIGCYYIQGYFYARPMPAEDYELLTRSAGKEQRLLKMETVKNLDNNALWAPESMDTLIFNSFVNGAVIFEFHAGKIEMLRANDKFETLLGGCLKPDEMMKLDWMAYLDAETRERLCACLHESAQSLEEFTEELCFHGLPGCQPEVFLRSTMRVIATAGDSYLVYCANENITALRLTQRKEQAAERERAASLAQLTTIIENINGGVTLSVEKGGRMRFLFANDQFFKLLGCTREDYNVRFRGEPQSIHLQDRARVVAQAREAAATGASYSSEFRIVRASGDIRWVLSHVTVMSFPGQKEPVLLTVVNDITETRVIEQKERETSERMQAILKNIRCGVTAAVRTGGKVRFLFANDRFYEILGYTQEQFEAEVGDPFALVRPEDREDALKKISRSTHAKEPETAELLLHVTRRDGAVRILHTQIGATRFTGIASDVQLAVYDDVTAEVEAQERLRTSEEEYRLATRQSDVAIARYKLSDRTLTLNAATAQRYGLPETLRDVPAAQISAGDVTEETAAECAELFSRIRSGEKHGRVRIRFRLSGELRWIEMKFSTIYASNGAPASAVMTLLDITDRLEQEVIYKKWRQSLREKKPESYTLFRCNLSKNAADDLREGTLITVKFSPERLTFNERTADYAAASVCEEDRERYIAFMDSNAMLTAYYRGVRYGTLEYRELLDDGRMRWLRLSVELVEYPNTADVEAYLLYEDIDGEKRAALAVQRQAEEDPLTGALNKAAFSAKVEEYLLAAREGTLCAMLLVDLDGFKQVNELLGRGSGDQALCEVAEGLRKVILQKGDLLGRFGGDAFLLFLHDMPDRAAVEGLARQICAFVRRSFSAEVQVTASVGGALYPRDGQDFETLYRCADAAATRVKDLGRDSCLFYRKEMEEERETTPGESRHRRRRILIVDDNRLDIAVLAEIFKTDCLIERALDGTTALIRLRHYGSAISAVLLDLMMPGVDGFTVLRKMQESPELRAIPVVVVSAADDHETCLKALDFGAADYVTKPVDPEQIRIRVRTAIHRAENERERTQSRLTELRDNAVDRYRTVLEQNGIYVIEHDWLSGAFIYDPRLGDELEGLYNDRPLWQILLSDMVTDTQTVQRMQKLVHDVASDRTASTAEMSVHLKRPNRSRRWYCFRIYKQKNDFGLTNRLLLTLQDAGEKRPADAPKKRGT
jgi:diguanylate cyclase (GGDEF)-like protein/PAS domain S-box-containing protein